VYSWRVPRGVKGELKIVATADLGGLGANEGPPLAFAWSGMPLSLPLTSGSRLVPWLAILGLFLLKPNRCAQAWLVWLPLLLAAGLALGVGKGLGSFGSGSREPAQPLVMAIGFGWAAALLLAPWVPRRQWLSRFGFMLAVFGAFGLLGLAFGRDCGQGMFDDLLQILCAVLLQFAVFALAAAVSLAGWFARQRFTLPGFLKWFVLWLIVVWAALATPCMILVSFGHQDTLNGLFVVTGFCSLGSFVASLPFLALSAASCLFRRRLRQLSAPPEPTVAAPLEAIC